MNAPSEAAIVMDWSELPDLFPELASPDRWLPLLKRHHELLGAAASHTRVTSVPAAESVRRHYAESLELWRIALAHTGESPARVVDVGSGGGFPGLVMACVARDVAFELVEPLQKRARLLEAIVAELGLSNVSVHGVRAEEAGRGPLRESAQLVTARAVAELRELLEYTAPVTAAGGLIVLPKGSALDEELATSSNAMAELGVTHEAVVPMRPEVSENVRVAVFRRTGALNSRYPRRAGMPAKRPL